MKTKEEIEDSTSDVSNEDEINVSFACEECDYHWEDTILSKDETSEGESPCPMCGSTSVIIIENS